MEPNKKPVSLDDFELIRLLGKGQYGKVLLVRHKQSSTLFAMKVIKKKTIQAKNQVAHTLSERSVLSRVSHPFIIQMHYAFHNSLNLYIVMEYCPGGELFFHLSKFQKLPEAFCKFYSACMVLALRHLHSLSIVYRDLKPENIVITQDGFPKITDFGLCKENIDQSCTTRTVCGTPEYIAPEVILRSGHGLAVDWWSLGCIIFEMLTGFPPFYSFDRKDIFRSIVQSKADIREIPASSQAKDIIALLLVKDPKYRLGAAGAEEVMKHEWFVDIDWSALERKQVRPPFVPRINGPLDVSCFSEEFTKGGVDSPMPSPSSPIGSGTNFKGFSYNGKEDSGCIFNDLTH